MRASASPRLSRSAAVVGALVALAACSAKVEQPAPSGSGASAGNSGGAGGSSATGGTGGSSATGGAGGSSATGGTATGGAGGSAQAGQPALDALESGARRITREELDRAVRDLFADDTAPAGRILAEDEYRPFDNDYTIQRASSALIDTLEAFADDVAARAVLPENRARVVPCTPAGNDDAACLEQTVLRLGEMLFRRPFTSADAAPYLGLLSFATEDNAAVDNDFYTAVELVLRSMLQDPEFLYRIEVGTPGTEPGTQSLTSYERATRLSFLLWGSVPDEQLRQDAAVGALVNPTRFREHAVRLLADPRAREAMHRFHAMWLGYRAIPATADLLAGFSLETNKLIDRVVFDQPSSYLDLFTAPETYLTSTLATHYGLPEPSGGEGWVPYGTSGRAGILSHGSVLAGFSKFSDTSPTQRGIFVQTRLLCNVVEPPPANVNVDEPPSSADLVCKTDRYAAHRDTPSCAGCHGELDPIGLGLEQYDIAGRYRTHDDGHDECVLDGVGELPGYGTFNGPAELGQKLVETGELEGCFVEHVLRYSLGRAVKAEEASVVAALADGFRTSGFDVQALLADYASSPRFVARREEPVP
jgi:hypothetical protein